MSGELITFRCPQCQATLSLPSNLAGAKGPCLYCETEIVGPNPALSQPARLASAPEPEQPSAPEPEHQPSAPAPAPIEPLSVQLGATNPPAQHHSPTPESPAPSDSPISPLPFPVSQVPSPFPPTTPGPRLNDPAPTPQPRTPERQQPNPPFPKTNLPPTRQFEPLPDLESSEPFSDDRITPPAGNPASPSPSPFPSSSEPTPILPVAPEDSPGSFGSLFTNKIPFIIGGGLIILLILFGIYLWRDFNNPAAEKSANNNPENSQPVLKPAPAPQEKSPNPASTPGAETTPPTPATAVSPPVVPGAGPDITPPVESTTPPTPEGAETTTAAAGSTSSPGGGADRETAGTGGLLDDPLKALQNFLNAPNWEKRVEYALFPNAVKPLMEIYYRNREDGVVVPTSMRFQHSETDPDTKHRFYVFHLTTETSPDGFPVLIEDTEDGLKVDWETFVEFKDNLFQEFASNPSPGKAGTFHVIMRNAHFFGNEFPELKDLTTYRIDPPIPDHESYAFARSESMVNQELQKQVTWGMNFTPFLELRWAKSKNGTDYLQIVRLLHTNWRNRNK